MRANASFAPGGSFPRRRRRNTLVPTVRLDLRDRAASFAALEAEPFDLLVVGAGITGAGIARDAALRGLHTALVDARDFAAGTSSRSSKLVHGGLRYLAQGDVGVVREAATERKTLRRIAPHLAQTLPMLVPARSWGALQKIRAGLVAYETLGSIAAQEKHEVWDRARLERDEPVLRSSDLVGAVVYPEYLTDDAKLTLANVRSSAAAGATVLSYAALEELIEDSGGRGFRAGVIGRLPGEERRAEVHARLVVNAAGPWVDSVRRLQSPTVPEKLQLTRGIHLVFRRSTVPVHHTVIMTAPDKRGLFAVPRGELVYLGTTDTFYPAPEAWPTIDADDVAYLLEAAERYLDARLRPEDIVALWSGLRPLLRQEGKSPSEISRRDEILEGPHGLLSIAGGKLTAYRRMAQRVVDRCQERLGRKPSPSRTHEALLVAAPAGEAAGAREVEAEARQEGASAPQAERLVRLYGTEAMDVLRNGGDAAAEVEHAVLAEGALQLEDWWVRRGARAWFDAEGGTGELEPASRRMAELLGWSETERTEQVRRCLEQRSRDLEVLENLKTSRESPHRQGDPR